MSEQPKEEILPGIVAAQDQELTEARYTAKIIHEFADELRQKGEDEDFVQDLSHHYLSSLMMGDD